MSKWKKLIDNIINLKADIRYKELKKILESYGYVENTPSGGSSHRVFRKEGVNPIVIPIHNPIKKIYIKLVRDIVLKNETKGDK